MKNVFHKNKWNTGTVQVHVDPSPVPLIKNKNYEKLNKDFLIKLGRDPTSQNSDPY